MECVGFLDELETAHPRVMWLFAHPDDEIIVAALLARIRFEMAGEVFLVVTTRGEGGNTLVPLGSQPDVGSIRVGEMRASAKLLEAELVQWDLGNTAQTQLDGVIEEWAKRTGGRQRLVDRFAAVIRDTAPDVLLTFDPRHGTTFHPDHRAVGTLAIEALGLLGNEAPRAWLYAARLVGFPVGDYTGCAPMVEDEPGLVCYDATEYLPTVKRQAWDYASLVASAHPSQMGPKNLSAIRAAPAELRRIYLVKLTDAFRMDDPMYAGLSL